MLNFNEIQQNIQNALQQNQLNIIKKIATQCTSPAASKYSAQIKKLLQNILQKALKEKWDTNIQTTHTFLESFRSYWVEDRIIDFKEAKEMSAFKANIILYYIKNILQSYKEHLDTRKPSSYVNRSTSQHNNMQNNLLFYYSTLSTFPVNFGILPFFMPADNTNQRNDIENNNNNLNDSFVSTASTAPDMETIGDDILAHKLEIVIELLHTLETSVHNNESSLNILNTCQDKFQRLKSFFKEEKKEKDSIWKTIFMVLLLIIGGLASLGVLFFFWKDFLYTARELSELQLRKFEKKLEKIIPQATYSPLRFSKQISSNENNFPKEINTEEIKEASIEKHIDEKRSSSPTWDRFS